MLKVIFLHIVTILLIFSQDQDREVQRKLTSSGPNPSFSTNTIANWSDLTSSPHQVSRSCCAFVRINGVNYIYQFGGGNSSSELRRVARLNLNTNVWTNNVTVIPSQISAGTAIAMRGDSLIYVFGGNNTTLGKTLRYNVYSNSWSTMSEMPTKVTDALVMKYSESLILVIGGGDGYFGPTAFRTNKVQVYNINSNSYNYLNSYPINCAMLGGGIYRDTIIGIGGYTDGGNATANCYRGVINPSNMNISWFAISPYPAGSITRPASYVAVKGEGVGIMCTGGAVNGTNPTSQSFLWNYCTNQWQQLPDNSLARSNFKASGRGSEIYVVAGFTTTGVGTTEKISFSYIDGPCSWLLGVGGTNNSIPQKFYLDQNYPNPFNPSTKISFGLPVSSKVTFRVYDLNGKDVYVLNKEYNAGRHVIEFNAANLASGVYFYKLITSDFNSTRKMLLIK